MVSIFGIFSSPSSPSSSYSSSSTRVNSESEFVSEENTNSSSSTFIPPSESTMESMVGQGLNRVEGGESGMNRIEFLKSTIPKTKSWKQHLSMMESELGDSDKELVQKLISTTMKTVPMTFLCSIVLPIPLIYSFLKRPQTSFPNRLFPFIHRISPWMGKENGSWDLREYRGQIRAKTLWFWFACSIGFGGLGNLSCHLAWIYSNVRLKGTEDGKNILSSFEKMRRIQREEIESKVFHLKELKEEEKGLKRRMKEFEFEKLESRMKFRDEEKRKEEEIIRFQERKRQREIWEKELERRKREGEL